ncbi:MAG: hypothetical protein ACREV9_09125 [Burkholderiales bacterium]
MSGIILFSAISVLAPIKQFFPITALLSITLLIPISELSPMVQPMQIDHMANAHVLADREFHADVGMQHRAILHVGVLSDRDEIVVAAHDRVVPNRHVVFEYHRPDHDRILGDKVIAAALDFLISERIDHSASTPAFATCASWED